MSGRVVQIGGTEVFVDIGARNELPMPAEELQTDEGELGFSYDELDRYLVGGEGSKELAERVEALRQRNAHKLRIPKLPPASAS